MYAYQAQRNEEIEEMNVRYVFVFLFIFSITWFVNIIANTYEKQL
jgi:hypothetical protein